MKRLILTHWYYIALIGLAVVTFILAAKAGRESIAAEQLKCTEQGGQFINHWRYTRCRVKGDAR